MRDKAERPLTLGELRSPACSAETVFFAFNLACIAGQQAHFAEFNFRVRIENFQRPGNTELASVRLAGRSTAADGNDHVDFRQLPGRVQRSQNRLSLLFRFEELLHFTTIDTDFSGAGSNTNPRNRRFTASGSKTVVLSVSFDDKVAQFDH